MNWWAPGPLVSPPVCMWAILPLYYFGILPIGSDVCLPLKAVLLRKPLFRTLFWSSPWQIRDESVFWFVSVHSMLYDGYSCCLFVKWEALIQFQLTALWGVFWVFGRILAMIIWPKKKKKNYSLGFRGKKEKIGWDERMLKFQNWFLLHMQLEEAGLIKTSLDNSDCEQTSPFRRKLHSSHLPKSLKCKYSALVLRNLSVIL